MEDMLYENLENYEDVNDVNELKNENKELKLKLEEYSRALNELQKDFDKLNSEYKKLEINYSSLLITARAEIERKGEIIKNLNLEKDKLIIDSIQKNGVNMLRNRNFHVSQKSTSKQDKLTGLDKAKTKQVDDLKDKFSGDKNNSLNHENRSTFSEEKMSNVDKHKITNKEMKENLNRNSHKDGIQPDAVSKRVMNRRKSTPASSFQETKFSSDEDIERINIKNTRRSPPRSTRYMYDNRDYRVDSCNYYGSSDSNRSRNSNYMDYNTHRHADILDMNRSQRYGSPDRNPNRYSNDYSRHRLLKSPPPDKYNRSKSRDRRYNYDREIENYHERQRYYEHSSLKHKMRNDFDEPSSKRQRTEQYSKCPSQDSNYISDREKEFSERRQLTEPGQFSCQSPDYVLSENHISQHYIKEIRNTAVSFLEDPRISSKKYVLQTYSDKKCLLIPSNRDVDIQCVDKKIWGLEKVKVPEALKSKPSSVRESEDYLNQIYSNMEENESLESGEIQSIEDVVILNTKEKEKVETKSNYNIPKKSENQNIINTAQQIVDSKMSQSKEYKIPKKSQKSVKKLDTTTKDNDKNTITYKGDLKISIDSSRLSVKFKDKEHDSKPPISSKCKSKQSTDDNKKECNVNKKKSNKPSDDKILQDNIRTVQGDLELSDEESDPLEFHKEIEDKLPNKIEPNAISPVNKSVTNSNVLKNIKNNVSVDKADNIKTEATCTKESSNTKSSSKESCRESGKKRKGKKKSESKETTSIKDPNKDAEDKNKDSEKDSKKKSFEQKVNKFSDLFGDSSSLITPDDLGIQVTDSQVGQDMKYTSIFENTEDAIDLSVEDIKKAQVSTTEVKSYEVVVENVPTEENKTNSSNVISNRVCENEENSELSSMYENVKSETLIESANVVKTVIISTGVQPLGVPESNVLENNTMDDKSNSNNLIAKKCPLSNIKALATSTPQKLLHPEDTSLPTQDADSNTNNASLEVNSSFVNNSSSITTTEPNTEDVPDCRIFVKRRRKVKKPTT